MDIESHKTSALGMLKWSPFSGRPGRRVMVNNYSKCGKWKASLPRCFPPVSRTGTSTGRKRPRSRICDRGNDWERVSHRRLCRERPGRLMRARPWQKRLLPEGSSIEESGALADSDLVEEAVPETASSDSSAPETAPSPPETPQRLTGMDKEAHPSGSPETAPASETAPSAEAPHRVRPGRRLLWGPACHRL